MSVDHRGARRYLERFSEIPDATVRTPPRAFDYAVAIPCFDEPLRFMDTVVSISRTQGAERAVLIVVVNAPEDASASALAANEALLSDLSARLGVSRQPACWGVYGELTICLIDRSSPGRRLPVGQGVGLARKIAADLALRWYCSSTLGSPWLCCTDADVLVPTDYLMALPSRETKASAALYPFTHILEGSAAQHEAMSIYESYLRYHVLGLRSAGSPFAYHAIGSTLAVNLKHYGAVRGFPRRLAGEDFYLLNKLRKLAPFVHLTSSPIGVRGRTSERVPFGTGRAINGIQHERAPFLVYHPDVYLGLSRWRAALDAFAQSPHSTTLEGAMTSQDSMDGVLREALGRLGAIDAAIDASRRVRSGAALKRRLTEWNDAFRTLKLIHQLRDIALPSLPLKDALALAPFIPDEVAKSPLSGLPKALAQLELPHPSP